MARRGDGASLLALHLDPAAAAPLFRQLYDALRLALLGGRLAPGARLPSSRLLARELGISRNTVLLALDQLLSEGYIIGRGGSGTFVSRDLPERSPRQGRRPPPSVVAAPELSRRGLAFADRPGAGPPGTGARPPPPAGPFAPGVPDCRDFPFEPFARLLGHAWRHPQPALFRRQDPAGQMPLRAAIADYLKSARGVRCKPEQVFIVSGSRQAIDLATRLLIDPGDGVWIEEPGYPGNRDALAAGGARLLAVPVDEEGLDVQAGERAGPARLACVTPSHQYPLGATMSLGRRLSLLAWARATGAWIIEDDFDSEFRYAGRPLAALQGLDEDGRVVYLGSFSKVLFPSLRLGYLVVPAPLLEPFRRARAVLDDYPSALAQPALAAFLADGSFAAHVRRMRRRYALRQQALLAAARRHLGGLLTLAPDPAGMHLVADLAPALALRMDDREAAARAAAAGIGAPALSFYYLGKPARQGLLLGYAALNEAEIEQHVRRLAAALAP